MTNLKKAQLGAIVKGIKAGYKAAKGVFTAERAASKEAKLAKIAEEAAKKRKAEIAKKAAETRRINAEKKAAAAANASKPKPSTTTKKTTAKPSKTKPATPEAKPTQNKTVMGGVKKVGKVVKRYGIPAGVGYAAGSQRKKSNKEIAKSLK